MSWSPISLAPLQYVVGDPASPASGYVLKAYIAGTTTNTPMATDATGNTTFNDIVLNSEGRPENGGSEVIPFIDRNYKLSLFATQAAADANTPAVWSIDNLSPVGAAGTISVTDANNNTVTNIQTLEHQTSGTPAAGIGAGLLFKVETAPNNVEEGASIEAVTTDVTDTSEDFDLTINLMKAGATKAEVARFTPFGFAQAVNSGVTAGTTQTQVGATALTAGINEVSVCANANDGVALPSAREGLRVTVINNGAEDLQIWPADSDKIDGGSADAVDSNVLASGDTRTYVAKDATDWYAEGAATSSGITRSARTSNTILAAADNGTLIDFTSGTFTQTLTAAATLGAGWFFKYKNSGTGIITLDPNGSETIDGATTLVILPGDEGEIQCDGSNFHRVSGGSIQAETKTLISTTTISTDATADFSLPGGYDYYELEFVEVVIDDTRNLLFTTSTDGGSSFATAYAFSYGVDRGGNSVDVVGAATAITMALETGSAGTENGVSGWVKIFNPSGTTHTHIIGESVFFTETGNVAGFSFGGATAAADVDTLRIVANSGNLGSGTVYFWGVRRSA